jgi:deoxyadenosine/deoxycytidine kinase
LAEYFHLVVAGNIGAGKTTVTSLLGERLGWRCYHEQVAGNPFLEPFYADMERWSFALQLFFLTHRLEDQHRIETRGESAIQDRSIHEDALIFARNLHEMGKMGEGEWNTYMALYRQLLALIRPPDLIVYLRRGIPGLMQNIQLRGRDYEREIPEEYLSRLNRYYEEWIEAMPEGRVLLVEADRLDLRDHEEDLELLLAQIKAAFAQGELFGDSPPPPDPRVRLLLPGRDSRLA